MLGTQQKWAIPKGHINFIHIRAHAYMFPWRTNFDTESGSRGVESQEYVF